MSACAVASCVFDSLADMNARDKEGEKEYQKEIEEMIKGVEEEEGWEKEEGIGAVVLEKIGEVIEKIEEKNGDNTVLNQKIAQLKQNVPELNMITNQEKSGVNSESEMELERTLLQSYDLTNFYSEYVCLSMSLFSTCMSIRDSQHVACDTPIVGAIVGVIVATISPLRSVLTSTDIIKTEFRRIKEDRWLIRPLLSALSCLEICVAKVGYQVAFRESEGLGPITDIIEIFGINAQILSNLVHTSMIHVLDTSFSLLCTMLSNTRRNAAGPAESGIQVLYQQYFSKLCCQVFKSPFKDLKVTWTHLLSLIRFAIDVEPAFLAQFLRSTYASVLSDVLKKSSRAILLPSNCEVLLMPLTRLASSMSFTLEGQNYVVNNNFIPSVVQILVDPALTYPHGEGLSSDTISRYIL